MSELNRFLEDRWRKFMADAVEMGMTPTRAATQLREYEVDLFPRGWLDRFAASLGKIEGATAQDYACARASARENAAESAAD